MTSISRSKKRSVSKALLDSERPSTPDAVEGSSGSVVNLLNVEACDTDRVDDEEQSVDDVKSFQSSLADRFSSVSGSSTCESHNLMIPTSVISKETPIGSIDVVSVQQTCQAQLSEQQKAEEHLLHYKHLDSASDARFLAFIKDHGASSASPHLISSICTRVVDQCAAKLILDGDDDICFPEKAPALSKILPVKTMETIFTTPELIRFVSDSQHPRMHRVLVAAHCPRLLLQYVSSVSDLTCETLCATISALLVADHISDDKLTYFQGDVQFSSQELFLLWALSVGVLQRQQLVYLVSQFSTQSLKSLLVLICKFLDVSRRDQGADGLEAEGDDALLFNTVYAAGASLPDREQLVFWCEILCSASVMQQQQQQQSDSNSLLVSLDLLDELKQLKQTITSECELFEVLVQLQTLASSIVHAQHASYRGDDRSVEELLPSQPNQSASGYFVQTCPF